MHSQAVIKQEKMKMTLQSRVHTSMVHPAVDMSITLIVPFFLFRSEAAVVLGAAGDFSRAADVVGAGVFGVTLML